MNGIREILRVCWQIVIKNISINGSVEHTLSEFFKCLRDSLVNSQTLK